MNKFKILRKQSDKKTAVGQNIQRLIHNSIPETSWKLFSEGNETVFPVKVLDNYNFFKS